MGYQRRRGMMQMRGDSHVNDLGVRHTNVYKRDTTPHLLHFLPFVNRQLILQDHPIRATCAYTGLSSVISVITPERLTGLFVACVTEILFTQYFYAPFAM